MKRKSLQIWTLAFATMFAFSALAIGIYFGARDASAAYQEIHQLPQIPTRPPVMQISNAPTGRVAINNAGKMFRWGQTGPLNQLLAPTIVGEETNWATVSVYTNHILAINTLG